MGVLPGAEPFAADGGEVGVVLSHGFTGTPHSMRPWVADLPRLTAPVLLHRSRVDHVVEPLSGRLLPTGAHSTDVTEIILEDSYHVATLDDDAPTIFAGSLDRVRTHSTAPAAG